MIPGIENASLAHIVKSPWLDKDLRQGMTNLTVRIVLVNFSQSVALPALNQLQVRIYQSCASILQLKITIRVSVANFTYFIAKLEFLNQFLKIKLVELATLQILTKIIVQNRHWWHQIHLLRGSPLA